MNKVLSRRRLKLLRMLAKGYSPRVVVKTLSKEYNCSVRTICNDYSRLNDWAHVVDDEFEFTRFLKFILHNENGKDLKVTVEEIELVQELGLLGRETLKIDERYPVATPFEADPMLREALLESIVKQKAEKVERNAAKTDAIRR